MLAKKSVRRIENLQTWQRDFTTIWLFFFYIGVEVNQTSKANYLAKIHVTYNLCKPLPSIYNRTNKITEVGTL